LSLHATYEKKTDQEERKCYDADGNLEVAIFKGLGEIVVVEDIFEELGGWQESSDCSDSQQKDHEHKDHGPDHTRGEIPDKDRINDPDDD
jgi:hypothetical protein